VEVVEEGILQFLNLDQKEEQKLVKLLQQQGELKRVELHQKLLQEPELEDRQLLQKHR
jgi:hypothetical protein